MTITTSSKSKSETQVSSHPSRPSTHPHLSLPAPKYIYPTHV